MIAERLEEEREALQEALSKQQRSSSSSAKQEEELAMARSSAPPPLSRDEAAAARKETQEAADSKGEEIDRANGRIVELETQVAQMARDLATEKNRAPAVEVCVCVL
jgi:hypothetical protein